MPHVWSFRAKTLLLAPLQVVKARAQQQQQCQQHQYYAITTASTVTTKPDSINSSCSSRISSSSSSSSSSNSSSNSPKWDQSTDRRLEINHRGTQLRIMTLARVDLIEKIMFSVNAQHPCLLTWQCTNQQAHSDLHNSVRFIQPRDLSLGIDQSFALP